jgi:aquaporin Z
MKKYISELIGTFTLALVVTLAVGGGAFSIPIPVLAAFVVGIFVYAVGSISGAHLNPIITIAMLATKEIKGMQGIAYIVSQFLGGILALIVAGLLNVNTNVFPTSISIMSGVAEALGAFVFAFGVGAVYYKKVSSSGSGIVVALSLLVGISTAGLVGSYGLINPAVALATGMFDMFYLLGPVIGFTVGFMVYRWLIDSPHIEVQVTK